MAVRDFERRIAKRKAERLPKLPGRAPEDRSSSRKDQFTKPTRKPNLQTEAAVAAEPKLKMHGYVDRMRKLRERRIEKRVGKSLMVKEHAMLQYIFDNKVPTMMQHCILKVYQKVSGSPKDKCISAFNICAANFQRHGYMKSGSMSPTGKGMKRNRMHQREPVAGRKMSRYWGLMTRLWSSALQRVAHERDVESAGAKKKR